MMSFLLSVESLGVFINFFNAAGVAAKNIFPIFLFVDWRLLPTTFLSLITFFNRIYLDIENITLFGMFVSFFFCQLGKDAGADLTRLHLCINQYNFLSSIINPLAM